MTLGGSKKTHPTHETREFVGRVVRKEGTLHKAVSLEHPQYYQVEVDRFSVGDIVTVRVTNKRRRRTLAQNAYMHVYFTAIAVAHGHGVTMDDVKSWAVQTCLRSGITEVYGTKVRRVTKTSELTILEMVEFIARVEVESGIPAPDPTPFQLPMTREEWDRAKAKERRKYEAMRPAAMV